MLIPRKFYLRSQTEYPKTCWVRPKSLANS